MANSRSIIGSTGEELAVQHLLQSGYEIRGRNIRLGRDEIDIVAYDPVDDVIAFVEVKSRKKDDVNYRPELNIDKRKRHAITRAARRWITENNFERGYRVDLICVTQGRIANHWKQIEIED